MKKLLFFIFLCCVKQINAQVTFQKTYGTADYEELASIHKTPDGGYMMLGSNFTQFGAIFFKIDSNGVLQFSKKYNSAFEPGQFSPTTDGGWIAAGAFIDTNNYRPNNFKGLLTKLNADGSVQWSKVYGDTEETCRDVKQTADKGYITLGISGSKTGYWHLYVIKTDSLGNLQWTKKIISKNFPADSDSPSTVMQTADGNYVIFASLCYNSIPLQHEVYLVKLSANGAVLWEHAYLLSNTDVYACELIQTIDKGFMMATEGMELNFGNAKGAVLIKADSTGNLQWCKQYNCNKNGATGIVQTPDSGYAFCGNSGTNNIFLCKTTANGTVQWAKSYGDTIEIYSTLAAKLLQNSNGQYIIGGCTGQNSAGLSDYLLIKTDSLGNTYCNDDLYSLTTTTIAVTNGYIPTKDTLGNVNTITFQVSATNLNENIICYDIAGIPVKAPGFSASIIIPNIFTPNNDDINDQFTITGINIDNYTCSIYDKWGLLMFECNQITTSWNGKNKEGNPASEGIYFYIIKANGHNLPNKTYKGFVTLLR